MIQFKVGDKAIRIGPPRNSAGIYWAEGYAQTGTVTKVTEDSVFVEILVDQHRLMEFDAKTSFDKVGLGSFLIRPDWL